MALQNAVQGGRRPSQVIVWADADGDAVDLTGATITAVLRHRTGAQTSRASDGAFVVMDAAAGRFRWDYGAQDVATPGRYEVQFSAAFGTDPTPLRSFAEAWTVEPYG